MTNPRTNLPVTPYQWDANPLVAEDEQEAARVGWVVAGEIWIHMGNAAGSQDDLREAAHVFYALTRANMRLKPGSEPYHPRDLNLFVLDASLRYRIATADEDETIAERYRAGGLFDARGLDANLAIFGPWMQVLRDPLLSAELAAIIT